MSCELELKLEHYRKIVEAVILAKQDPCSGLLPASTEVTEHGNYRDAWVRDNVYSIMAVWGLALAYRKIDDVYGHGFELEKSVIKLMRGLLFAMMQQSAKVEKFKHTQSPQDSLHAKYNTSTGQTVVGDFEWGHLQVDATSLFLLMLAQMTASGLVIIYTKDEVNFVQNLVYYIERTYRIPDYGIWERGNKINSGNTELNSSSIGMATAALEAIAGMNLFGAHGGPTSVIHVLLDEIIRNEKTLCSFLPRESKSKEIDSSLLSIISFPAFAVPDEELINKTRNEIVTKLEGKYGCKRFLLDGHQTVVEDTNRLHYEPYELKKFKKIECEWPLFFTYFILDGIFRGDQEQVKKYQEKLKPLLIYKEINGIEVGLVPELYYVPEDNLTAERNNPGSQTRLPNKNVPLVWAQSLYLLGEMLSDELLLVGELDPLNRRSKSKRKKTPAVVQVALLAEDQYICDLLQSYGLETQTPSQVEPIQVCLPNQLRDLYCSLGRNSKLGLTGRPPRPIGALSTCKIYRLRGKLYVFTPRFMEQENYLSTDNELLISLLINELLYIANHWTLPGRPTMTIILKRSMFSKSSTNRFLEFVTSLKHGECSGIKIKLGNIGSLMYTGCIVSMDDHFLNTPQPIPKEQSCLLKEPTNSSHIQRSLSIVDLSTLNSDDEEFVVLDLNSDDQIEFAIKKLQNTHNIYEQSDILHYLNHRKGLKFDLGFATVETLLLELFRKVTALKVWPIVRQVAGELKMILDNITIGIISILVHQMQITFGEPNNELVISDSFQGILHPSKLSDVIYSHYSNKQEACLVQEIILYLSSFLNAEPYLFEYIKRIRMNFIIIALRDERCRALEFENQNPEERMEQLLSMSPYEIKALLRQVLEINKDVNDVPLRTPPTILKIRVQSGGFSDGNLARCVIEGEKRWDSTNFTERGINVLTLNAAGQKVASISFDTCIFAEKSGHLANFIRQQEEETLMIFIAKDDASNQLTEEVCKVLEELGSKQISNLKFRDSWCMVAVKGRQDIYPTVECYRPCGSGMAEVNTTFLVGRLETTFTPSNNTWFYRRQIDGAINRVPPDFYSKVWTLLKRSEGICISKTILPREPTIFEMTRGEWQFAIRVERLLDHLQLPTDRAIAVETLIVISEIHSRNPELRVKGTIPIDEIIMNAIKICWQTFHPEKEFQTDYATKLFYDLPPEGQYGTMSFLGKSVVQILPYDVSSGCIQS